MANTDYKFSRDNNIYVIAGLPVEDRVKYKYYSDIKSAVYDAPSGSSVIVTSGVYTLNASLDTIGDPISITKNLNLHFEAGAIINSSVINTFNITAGDVNITGYLEAIISKPLFFLDSSTTNYVKIEIAKITNLETSVCMDLRGSGIFNIKVGEISSPLNSRSVNIKNMHIDSVLEIGKSNAGITLSPTITTDTISGTIKNTFIKGGHVDLGGLIFASDNAVINITIQNTKLYNTINGAGSAGIEHSSGFVGMTIKLINSVIQTTHASSASISTDDTLTLMALNSWANKATNGTINQTVTGGFTVEADVTV